MTPLIKSLATANKIFINWRICYSAKIQLLPAQKRRRKGNTLKYTKLSVLTVFVGYSNGDIV